MNIRLIIAIACLTVTGCKEDPAEDFLKQQQEISWYPPAKEALDSQIANYHSSMHKSLQDEGELAKFVGGPLVFQLRPKDRQVWNQIDWSEINLEPIGRYTKDPRRFNYRYKIRHVEGTTAVLLDNKSHEHGQ